jgi:hypothetical protein
MKVIYGLNGISNRDRLKKLSLKTANRRSAMLKFAFIKKDDAANENFNDLEKEVYSTIK